LFRTRVNKSIKQKKQQQHQIKKIQVWVYLKIWESTVVLHNLDSTPHVCAFLFSN